MTASRRPALILAALTSAAIVTAPAVAGAQESQRDVQMPYDVKTEELAAWVDCTTLAPFRASACFGFDALGSAIYNLMAPR